MFDFSFELNKEFILSRLSQEEIFYRYLGFEVDYNDRFRSPLREDSNPTCTFRETPQGIIIFKDWAGHFSGNCFDIVMKMYSCSFWDACKIIANDFNLKDSNINKLPIIKPKKKRPIISDIKVKWKDFTLYDIRYWDSYGITKTTLDFYQSSPIEYGWVNDKLIYTYSEKDPGYGYYFNGFHKLYFPLREDYRFLGNFKGLQGYFQLPKTGDLLIITKSLKDVMFLYQLDIWAVAPASESSILSQSQYEELSSRFDKILLFYDFDLTGVRSVNKMKKLYNLPYIFLTNGRFKTKDYGGKDCTDLYKNIGIKSKKIIMELCEKQY